MVTGYRYHEKAERTEREITEYLKQLGFFIVPAANFNGNGAPMVEAANRYESIVMPDQIGLRDGRDVKWKSNAFPWRNEGNRLATGIDENSYLHYRRFALKSGMHVVVVFCHEEEDEVRCGTLDRLEMNRAPNGPADSHGKGGMHNWWYEDIALWMPFHEMKLCVREKVLDPVEIPAGCWAPSLTPRTIVPQRRPDPSQQSLFSNLGSMTADTGETDPLRRRR